MKTKIENIVFAPLMALWITGLISTTIFQACAKRIGSTQPVTPYEHVLVSNAILASVNRSVSSGVIEAQRSGLLPLDKAKAVLDVNFRIATADEELTTILAKGPELAKADAAKIQELVNTIRDAALTLVDDETLAIKNPASKESVRAQIGTIVVIANKILSDLRVAGVL